MYRLPPLQVQKYHKILFKGDKMSGMLSEITDLQSQDSYLGNWLQTKKIQISFFQYLHKTSLKILFNLWSHNLFPAFKISQKLCEVKNYKTQSKHTVLSSLVIKRMYGMKTLYHSLQSTQNHLGDIYKLCCHDFEEF